MKLIHGDILEILPPGGILFHQVNTLGKFNAGLAGQIRKKWPEVASGYEQYCRITSPCIGDIYTSGVYESKDGLPLPNRYVCHLFAQSEIGRSKRYTNYSGLVVAMKVAVESDMRKAPCFFPHKMGCGLGGGDWLFVEQLIEENFPDATIVKLP